jgi:hypothetical protein
VDISMLVPSVGAAAVAQPPTRVRRVATAEIASRWATARPSRARELRSREGSVLLSVDADLTHGYLMRTPIHGRFLVSGDGLEILCAPLARAASSWTALLIGQLLPLVATLRGLEVFHASAVAQGRPRSPVRRHDRGRQDLARAASGPRGRAAARRRRHTDRPTRGTG